MAYPTSMSVLIGIDIGTTICKLVAFTAEGEILAHAEASYDVSVPQVGFAELNPNDVVAAIAHVFLEVAPILADFRDLSLSFSVQDETFVPVDVAGNALMAAPISIDLRGRDAISKFNDRPEVKLVCENAGQTLNAASAISKLLWMIDEVPDILKKTDRILCLGEYATRALGVEPKMDYSMAARTGLLDNRRLDWSHDLIGAAGLTAVLFPDVLPSGTFIGMTGTAATRSLGLNSPIKIFSGGHNQACAMLGAGLVNSEIGLYSLGDSETLAFSVNSFEHELIKNNISHYPHVIKGKYVVLMGSENGNRVLQWFMGIRGVASTEDLLKDLPDAPSRVTVLPHLAGSGSVIADEMASGLISNLSYNTSVEELTHAVLEGITFEQAHSLSEAKKLGLGIERLCAVGEESPSSIMMQLKSDILGIPIDCLLSRETACAGAAILAGLGSGALNSLPDAAKQFVQSGESYSPRQSYSEIYKHKLSLFHEIYNGSKQHQASHQSLEARLNTLQNKSKCQLT